MLKANNQISHLSKKKRIIFSLILIFLPILFLSIFEITLNLFNYGGNSDLFIPASFPYEAYKKCNPQIGKRYFYKQTTIPQSSNDVFLCQKPENGYRIFVLGGSTTLGFPYSNMLMFSRILHKRLEDTFPEKRIEVVNVALTAVNSYTMLDFIDEILKEQPDAILIYAGHNEYYGALGVASLESIGKQRWVVLTYLKLNRFKTFVLLRNTIHGITGIFVKNKINPYGTLMERLVLEQNIPFNSKLYNQGKIQFKQNLDAIFAKAQKANVPILISELVCNIRDLAPLDSTVQLFFQAAKKFEMQQQFQQAKDMYYKAKDLDRLRFRAPEQFNEIIHQIADQYHSPVVPMKSIFENSSPHELIGNNLMVDHVHPNIDGYFVMADAFYNALQSNSFIATTWDPVYILPAQHYRAIYPITEIDSTMAELTIRNLKNGFPFKPKFTENRTLLDFQPHSFVESLALKVIFGEINMDEAHFQLAQYYESQKDFKHANKEYDAITYLVFIEAYSLLNRAQALLGNEKYDQALQLLLESLKQENIPLANRLAGEIYLKKGETEKASEFLKKVNQKIESPDEIFDFK